MVVVKRRARRDCGMHLTSSVDVGAGPADRVASKQSSGMTAEIEKSERNHIKMSCQIASRPILVVVFFSRT
jgi:hypothetical protein